MSRGLWVATGRGQFGIDSAPPPMSQGNPSTSCYGRLEGRTLLLGNDLFERRWLLKDGRLFAESFLDKRSGRHLFAAAATLPSLCLGPGCEGEAALQLRQGDGSPVGRPCLHAELTWGGTRFAFELFAAAAGLRMRLIQDRVDRPATFSSAAGAAPTGVEEAPTAAASEPAADDVIECFAINPLHQRLGEVTFRDRTDVHDNLVSQRTWLLSPAEREVELLGNLQWIENPLTGEGLVLLKEAPLPHARPVPVRRDGVVRGDGVCTFYGHGLGAEGGEGYAMVSLAYRGGAMGRTEALQTWQRQVRPLVDGRDGLLLSNTWGDRSRDARINEPFMRLEVAAGERLGVEVVQIDDGWQKGRSANSATAGGVWNGFWAADANFWQSHPQRFPAGLQGIIDTARQSGMGFGLWFSPDSSDDFANWQRDAEAILKMHRELGVRFIKIDGVKATTKPGERRLRQFFDAVLEGSGGQVTFDFDVTAETRPGYFGLMDVGPIFVENRYTDWHRYWPHRTLRNLWMLSHHVDPVRLRMEFLNPTRHAEQYAGDPLAPACYEAAALFAMVMVASPLGWFEVSQLPAAFVNEVGELVRLWKTHRGELHGGLILPVGDEPDGLSWSGFLSVSRDGAHLLAFRQLTSGDTNLFAWPASLKLPPPKGVRLLAGSPGASAEPAADGVSVEVPRTLGFAWMKVEFESQWRTGAGEPSIKE